ncbi:hypothetical protein N7519_007084 [Penicillium mononematosum]|uniref:uncharacterized protein n=1 Tax=Penicillium mononematosum TaxID=268346 RepID=UPI00254839CB|nr:uncharacterized protein N7519_007084 [Penicillium mononematosum]KAJ6185783.1 hypothetical protein N7519_007084 [Penicillium mononematosum]
MAFAQCIGAKETVGSHVDSHVGSNKSILLGTKTMRPAPAGENASTHPIYARPKVLHNLSLESYLFLRFISKYTASIPIYGCVECTPYASVILFEGMPKINNACACNATRRWILSEPMRPRSL